MPDPVEVLEKLEQLRQELTDDLNLIEESIKKSKKGCGDEV